MSVWRWETTWLTLLWMCIKKPNCSDYTPGRWSPAFSNSILILLCPAQCKRSPQLRNPCTGAPLRFDTSTIKLLSCTVMSWSWPNIIFIFYLNLKARRRSFNLMHWGVTEKFTGKWCKADQLQAECLNLPGVRLEGRNLVYSAPTGEKCLFRTSPCSQAAPLLWPLIGPFHWGRGQGPCKAYLIYNGNTSEQWCATSRPAKRCSSNCPFEDENPLQNSAPEQQQHSTTMQGTRSIGLTKGLHRMIQVLVKVQWQKSWHLADGTAQRNVLSTSYPM